MLFSPAKSGPVNMILYNLGVAAKELPKWSADKDWVMFTVILFSVWKNMGYYMVIYLAGLQGINGELYEACSLDGANTWQRFPLYHLAPASADLPFCYHYPYHQLLLKYMTLYICWQEEARAY